MDLDYTVRVAAPADLPGILAVQHEAFGRVAEELGIDPRDLPPLGESLDELVALAAAGVRFFVAEAGSTPIGSVRARAQGDVVEFGRLVVSDGYVRRGVATKMMLVAEASFPQAIRFQLFTGRDATAALALYERLGYRLVREGAVGDVALVWLEKEIGP